MRIRIVCAGPISLAISILAVALTVGEIHATAQGGSNPANRTIWDGVYAAVQAADGRVVYQTHCARCHGADLDGSASTSPLVGEAFIRNWGGGSMRGLFNDIRALMPRNFPSSLSDDEYLAVVTYILQRNDAPAGTKPVSIAELYRIQIVGRGGLDDAPNYALVQVVGCLGRGPDHSWTLVNGSKPLATRDPDASRDENVRNAEAQALGELTFRLLLAYPTPDESEAGQKFEAKGFLMKNPAGRGISVTSLQKISSVCEK
jgi:mono/diheme cytochrome c family protein